MLRTEVYAIRAKIEAVAQHIPENSSYEFLWMYPAWNATESYISGFICQHDNKIWKCRQNHTAQANFAPSVNTSSLWELIPPPNETGTQGNPIAYSLGMTLEEGKYYTQNNVLYLCIRNSGGPLYHDLSALINNYVEVVE